MHIQKIKSHRVWTALGMITALGVTSAFADDTTAAAGPSDAEIAHIVVTANQIDIDAGKLAQSKSKSKEVKEFAKRMITEHAGVNKEASALAKKLGVTPADNATSKSLKGSAKEQMAKLKTLKGKEFDKQYVDHEVTYHQTVLDAMDKTLVPNVDNADLKALIEKVRPAIVAHLDHAKKMQETLASGSTEGTHTH